jgi:hypothetical protein
VSQTANCTGSASSFVERPFGKKFKLFITFAVIADFASPAPRLPVGATHSELLPVKDVDNDMIRLLSRREIAAVLRKGPRTWIHTVREEFSTYYPLASLMRWLGGRPFIQIGRHAVVNERAIERVTHLGDRLYGMQLRDRSGTDIIASRTGAVRLAAELKFNSFGTRRGALELNDELYVKTSVKL